MKKITNLLTMSLLLLTISFCGCKNDHNDQIKPTENAQVEELKQFMATTAKVDVGLVKYDSGKDEFSINGTAKISRTNLLMFYDSGKGLEKPVMSTQSHINN